MSVECSRVELPSMAIGFLLNEKPGSLSIEKANVHREFLHPFVQVCRRVLLSNCAESSAMLLEIRRVGGEARGVNGRWFARDPECGGL